MPGCEATSIHVVIMSVSIEEYTVTKPIFMYYSQVVDLEALRELAWSGIPAGLRPTCWRLLLGYLPPNRERRTQVRCLAGGMPLLPVPLLPMPLA